MANRRDEQKPQPGYAATLMGEDANMVMLPLKIAATVMTVNMLQNLTLSMGPALESPLFAPKALEGPMVSPLAMTLGNNISGGMSMKSPMMNPFAGGPKMFGL